MSFDDIDYGDEYPACCEDCGIELAPGFDYARCFDCEERELQAERAGRRDDPRTTGEEP